MKSEVPYVINHDKASDVLGWMRDGSVNFEELANKHRVIPVVGGDGTMLEAIREHWSLGFPFFGINRGTKGFLLNPLRSQEDLLSMVSNLKFVGLSLMEVVFCDENGDTAKAIFFNDVYFNVAPGTVCRGSIRGGANYPVKHFSGDGIIIATPQGSTAYNKNAGGSVLPLKSDLLAIRTICSPDSIRDVVDSQDIMVEFSRGRIVAHADSQRFDDIVSAHIRTTQITVQLAFYKDYNFEKKRYE